MNDHSLIKIWTNCVAWQHFALEYHVTYACVLIETADKHRQNDKHIARYANFMKKKKKKWLTRYRINGIEFLIRFSMRPRALRVRIRNGDVQWIRSCFVALLHLLDTFEWQVVFLSQPAEEVEPMNEHEKHYQ